MLIPMLHILSGKAQPLKTRACRVYPTLVAGHTPRGERVKVSLLINGIVFR